MAPEVSARSCCPSGTSDDAGSAATGYVIAERETRKRPGTSSQSGRLGMGGLYDFAGADAACAGVYALGGAIDDGLDLLNIWIPAALGTPMGVADVHAPRGTFATYVANRCHC